MRVEGCVGVGGGWKGVCGGGVRVKGSGWGWVRYWSVVGGLVVLSESGSVQG